MIIRIDELLEAQGKTRYWLSKETGVTHPNITKLCNGETSSLRLDILESICLALQCDPGDILIPEYKKDL